MKKKVGCFLMAPKALCAMHIQSYVSEGKIISCHSGELQKTVLSQEDAILHFHFKMLISSHFCVRIEGFFVFFGNRNGHCHYF